MEEIKGIDISVWQKGIDYKAISEAGVKFAILRASYSKSKDTQLDNHVKGCTKQGIDIGYYVYSLARTPEEARQEAKACIDIIKKYPEPKYPVFFDLEDNDIAKEVSKTVHTDCAIAFCEELTASGYYSGIYTNPAWLESYYEKSRLVGKYDIWLAHWTEDPKYPSKYDYGQTMWQWGIDNIGMDIDGDICFINYPAKIKAYKEAFYSGKTEKDDKKDNPTGVKDTSNKDKPGSTSNKNVSDGIKYPVGTELTLNKTNIYVSSSVSEPSGVLSGKYFILSSSIINKRIRITTPKGNTVCTGWINTSDADKCISTSEAKHNATGTSSTVKATNTANTNKHLSRQELDLVATRVIRGEYGNGTTRRRLLAAAGYDYDEVMKRVNEIYNK